MSSAFYARHGFTQLAFAAWPLPLRELVLDLSKNQCTSLVQTRVV